METITIASSAVAGWPLAVEISAAIIKSADWVAFGSFLRCYRKTRPIKTLFFQEVGREQKKTSIYVHTCREARG